MTLTAQKVKLKTIFKDNWEEFWEEYREQFPKEMHKTIEESVKKMMGCGDIANGYFRYKCISCGHGDIKVGFSCKSRFCQRCGKAYTDEWVEKTAGAVADVTQASGIYNPRGISRNILLEQKAIEAVGRFSERDGRSGVRAATETDVRKS